VPGQPGRPVNLSYELSPRTPPTPTDTFSSTDDWDRHWVSYAESAALNPAQDYRRRLILSLLSADGPPKRVLDIGAGTGDLARTLRESFPDAEIGGIDVSAAGLELARQKVPSARFVVRDLLEEEEVPPDLQGWATHAVCSEVLEHVDDPVRLLVNAIPYLGPGCRLVVTVPGGPISAFDRHIGHRRHFRPSEVRQVLEQAGFEVDKALGAGFPLYNLYRLAVILRGRRLIEDAKSGGGAASRLAMRVFQLLFRLNVDSSRWGWQSVASARLPGP
jgi:SAM-dependent methyltransferase